jgi:sodium-dependent dicarboxylate transporter 2/3/5
LPFDGHLVTTDALLFVTALCRWYSSLLASRISAAAAPSPIRLYSFARRLSSGLRSNVGICTAHRLSHHPARWQSAAQSACRGDAHGSDQHVDRNTATTITMLPIVISHRRFLPPERAHGRDGTNFAAATSRCRLCCIYRRHGDPDRSPPNALAAGYLAQTFKVEVSFAEWMAIAFPIAAVMLGLTFLVLTRVVFPFSALAAPEARFIVEVLQPMGRMSAPEKRMALLFAVVVACWILYPFRWGPNRFQDKRFRYCGSWSHRTLCRSSRWAKSDLSSRLFDRSQDAPGYFILFGGGLSLAQAMESSGLAVWIGNGLSFLHGMPVIVLVAGVSLLLVFMTELISNTAATAAFLPIAGSLVIGADAAPMLIGVAVALAASSGFMLPVGTVPNALVFGPGYIALPQMVRAGFMLDLLVQPDHWRHRLPNISAQ